MNILKRRKKKEYEKILVHSGDSVQIWKNVHLGDTEDEQDIQNSSEYRAVICEQCGVRFNGYDNKDDYVDINDKWYNIYRCPNCAGITRVKG